MKNSLVRILCAVSSLVSAYSVALLPECELNGLGLYSLNKGETFQDFSLLRKHHESLEKLGIRMLFSDSQIVLFSDNPGRLCRLLAFYFHNIFDPKRLERERPLVFGMLGNLSMTPGELHESGAYAPIYGHDPSFSTRPEWLPADIQLESTVESIVRTASDRAFEHILEIDLSPQGAATLPRDAINRVVNMYHSMRPYERNLAAFTETSFADSVFELLRSRQKNTLFINNMSELSPSDLQPSSIENHHDSLLLTLSGLHSRLAAQKSKAFDDAALREKTPFVFHVLPLQVLPFFRRQTLGNGSTADRPHAAVFLLDSPINQWRGLMADLFRPYDVYLRKIRRFGSGSGLGNFEDRDIRRSIREYANDLAGEAIPAYLKKAAKQLDAESLNRFHLSSEEFEYLTKVLK